MPSICKPNGEIETLLERYEREAEINWRIEEKARMEQAMRAVDFVAPAMGNISHVGLIAKWDKRMN